MVGVPKESSGCYTCRRRKVKCDLEKPSCQRCIQSNRQCEGFERSAVFLNRTAQGLARRAPLEEAIPRSVSTSQPAAPGYGPHETKDDESQITSAHQHAYNIPPQMGDSTMMVRLFEGRFTENYFSSASNAELGGWQPWFHEVLLVNNPGTALRCSINALCITRAGRTGQSQTLIEQGRVAHGIALQRLQEAIRSSDLASNDDTLAACHVLGLYELFESTSDSVQAHDGHVLGAISLIRYRRNKWNDTPLSLALQEKFSYSTLVLGIQHRKSYLSLDFRRLPQVDTINKSLEFKLYETGHDIVQLLEDVDRFTELEAAENSNLQRELLLRFLQVDSRLENWHETLVNEAGSPTHWYSPSLLDENIETAEARDIYFTNLRIAQLTLGYWALCTILSSTLASFCSGRSTTERVWPYTETESPFFKDYDQQTPRPRVEDQRENIKYLVEKYNRTYCLTLATNILHSVPFCTRDNYGLASSHMVIFPLRVALFTFRKLSDPLMENCRNIITGLESKKGIKFARDIERALGRWHDV